MASKVKEIHQYDGTQWGQAVPIGADASNVDVRTSDNTDIPLQSVLGSFNATEPSIKTQINGKVDKEGGDVAHAVINDPVNQIPIYDLDTEETSEKLISDDISTDTDMVVMSGDGENLTTMWGKFNRFRKRVDNKFKNYLVTSLEGVAPGASSDTKGYSTQALNNYFNDVIGYTSAASVAQTGSVASQLSSLNSKTANIVLEFGTVNASNRTWFYRKWNVRNYIEMWVYYSVEVPANNLKVDNYLGLPFGLASEPMITLGLKAGGADLYRVWVIPLDATSSRTRIRFAVKNGYSTKTNIGTYVYVLGVLPTT